MYFIPVLDCQNCLQPILLLPPIQFGTFPNRTPWPWGNASQNFACLSCKQVYEYQASNCRWLPLHLNQIDAYRGLANYLLSVPCGEERQICQIDMIVVARKELPASEGNEIASGLYLKDVLCGIGHRHNRPISDKDVIAFHEMDIL